MSEMYVTLNLKVKPEDNEHWRILLEGLDRDEQAAYLEERIEPFGEEAEDLLEGMLDDSKYMHFEFNLLTGEHQKSEAADYSIQIMSNNSLSLCIPRIVELIEVCGAEVVSNSIYQEG